MCSGRIGFSASYGSYSMHLSSTFPPVDYLSYNHGVVASSPPSLQSPPFLPETITNVRLVNTSILWNPQRDSNSSSSSVSQLLIGSQLVTKACKSPGESKSTRGGRVGGEGGGRERGRRKEIKREGERGKKRRGS